MINVDEYALDLINKSKRFLEKANLEDSEVGQSAFYECALIFSVMSLETTVFSIAEEICDRKELELLDKSLLLEKEILFDKGKFIISDKLKISRLIDKIEFLFNRFNARFDRQRAIWWQHLNDGIKIRNNLIHPKKIVKITKKQVENTILSVMKCIDMLYRAIYGRAYPHFNRRLTTSYDF